MASPSLGKRLLKLLRAVVRAPHGKFEVIGTTPLKFLVEVYRYRGNTEPST